MHKSMSCFRQGSIIVVADEDFHTRGVVQGGVLYPHLAPRPISRSSRRSTWPAARWNSKGMSWCSRAIQLSLGSAREVNNHPLISKYFRIATTPR